MTQTPPHRRERAGETSKPTDRVSSPAETLAREVVQALVEADLISEDDGQGICSAVTNGKIDADRWKLVIENQLERKARSNGDH